MMICTGGVRGNDIRHSTKGFDDQRRYGPNPKDLQREPISTEGVWGDDDLYWRGTG
jgi:hypothetical protein